MNFFSRRKSTCLRAVALLIWGFCLAFPFFALAQTDKEFWFVAPNVYDAGRDFNKPIRLNITTLSSSAVIEVSKPADPSFPTISNNVAANSTISIDLTAWIGKLQSTPANAVLNKGLLIKSTADITVYYEVVSGFCNCNPEIFSLKGKNALGKEFFISSQYSYDESTAYSAASNSFDIVATANNTTVTITPSKAIIGHPANVPFNVVLNRGETYSAVASSSLAAGHLQGSYITATDLVAVTLKDDLVQVSSCADLIGDQAVPTDVLGTEYIVNKGYLQPNDKVYITAVDNNTSVYIDGSTTPFALLAKGQSTAIDLSNSSMYIRTDKKVYVYHLTGNGCEVGSAVIPKVNCTGSRAVSIVRSKAEFFAIMLTTKNGNQSGFSVNGDGSIISSSNFSEVPGTGGAYVSARIDMSNSASVGRALSITNSAGNFSLGFVNGGTSSGTLYGFFSDYKSSNVENSVLETCSSVPVQLNAYGGAAYKWLPATGLSNPNIANPTASPTVTTDYTVEITSADGCVDYAVVHVNVLPSVTPSINITASATKICPDTMVTFTASQTNGGSAPNYQWQVNSINAGNNSPTFASSTLINGDKVTCTLTSNALCPSPAVITSNTVTITSESNVPATLFISASQNNICPATPVTFTATAANAGSSPSYQWQVNGINTGANSPTLSISSLVNGDKVTCTVTVISICAAPNAVTSNEIVMVVSANQTPTINISASETNICEGEFVTLTAIAANAGNAPMYQWRVNGVNAGTNNATFTSSSLLNGDVLTCIVTSNSTCSASPTAVSNNIVVIVNAPVVPSVRISASTTNVCQGYAITYTATPTNSGSSPTYVWNIDGQVVIGFGASFTTSALDHNYSVSCSMTSSEKCVAPTTVVSNSLLITVNAGQAPAVTVTASETDVCQGTAVTFTAIPVNGGNAPIYQWLVNGINAGTNSPTFSKSTLNNGDKVSCMLTSNAPCATPTVASSNVVTITANSLVTPSVTITASNNTVCPGEAIIFNALAVNGGTLPLYQWRVNGIITGANSASFTSTTLSNGDVVDCIITGNNPCSASTSATSNSIKVAVNVPVTPSISINASSNNVCYGTTITFTAKPVNGGTTPVYDWLINGISTGVSSPTFTSSTINNSDIISCGLTSNARCAVPVSTVSNTIPMLIKATLVPSVSISASQNNVCEQSTITFRATPVNEGNNPIYQWLINGINAGASGPLFTTNALANGDKVSCILTSNAPCAAPVAVTSNVVTVSLIRYVTPGVVITASTTNICPGNPVSFNATATDGGASPVYQWMLNGANAGSNSASFISSNLSDGDVITCKLTSTSPCSTSVTANSNALSIQVNTPVAPSVTIAASTLSICNGEPITFTAASVNGGTNPIYQWLVNGSPVGTNSSLLTISSLNNNDIVSCRLTSAAKCVTPVSIVSNELTVNVNALPVITVDGDKVIEKGSGVKLNASLGGNTADITWLPSTGLSDAKSLTPMASPDKTTLYTITATSASGCTSSNLVKVTVLIKVLVPNTFTPNGDGKNDTWEIKNLADYPNSYVKVFNRWGAEVYYSKGQSPPWDGTMKGKPLPFGNYYYVINLDNKSNPISGYVTIVR